MQKFATDRRQRITRILAISEKNGSARIETHVTANSLHEIERYAHGLREIGYRVQFSGEKK